MEIAALALRVFLPMLSGGIAVDAAGTFDGGGYNGGSSAGAAGDCGGSSYNVGGGQSFSIAKAIADGSVTINSTPSVPSRPPLPCSAPA